jgi:hypothetical protein
VLKRTAGRMCHNAPCARCDNVRPRLSVSAGSQVKEGPAIRVILIPLGLASFKIIPIALVPLGVRIVPEDSL